MSTVRLPSRQRRWPAYVIGAIVLLGLLFTIMSQFYVDLLWFREVGYTSVFWTELRTKLLLGAAFGAVFFAVLYVNLLIVRRIAPTTRFLTPDQEAIERVRQAFEPYLRWLIPRGVRGPGAAGRDRGHARVADLPAVAQLERGGVR